MFVIGFHSAHSNKRFTSTLSHSTDSRLIQRKDLSLRVFLVVLYLMVLIICHSFTGRLTSFLNLPIMDTAVNTNEKLLHALRTGSIEPCVTRNSYVHTSLKVKQRLFNNKCDYNYYSYCTAWGLLQSRYLLKIVAKSENVAAKPARI